MVLFESIVCEFAALLLVLIACEAGHRISDTFEKMDDTFEEIDWYLLPIDVQRMLPVVLMYVQETMVPKFFGSISCSREQFRKVSQRDKAIQGHKKWIVVSSFFV